MSQTVINGLLIGGMVIILLLILGVLGALRSGRRAMAPVPSWADADGVDLEDRLRKITLNALKPAADPDPGPAAGFRVETLGATLERTTPSEPAARAEPFRPAPSPTQAAPTSRLALPTSGSIRPSEYASPSAQAPSEGLSPLAARFGALESPRGAPLGAEPAAGDRYAVPGSLARDLGISGRGAENDDQGAGLRPTMPGARPGLPGKVAGGFTEMPSLDMPPITPMQPYLPPTESTLRREAFDGPAARRPQLPGQAVARGEPPLSSPSMLDIRAILRGDTPSAPPAAAAGVGFAVEPPPAPHRPAFATPSTQEGIEEGAPLGSAPFDANLLRVREPAATTPRPAAIARETPAGKGFSVPPVVEAPAEQTLANGRLIDLDATRIVEDFDLPDTGFETHVFSTSELVEGESLGLPSFTSALPEPPPPPAVTPPPAPAPTPAAATAAPRPPAPAVAPSAVPALTLAQQEQARGIIGDLAALTDVAFVKLIAENGSVILGAGQENGDVALDGQLAALVRTATMEIAQLDLGDCQTLSVEAAGAALLLAPVRQGAALAVLLSNPTRLGLLRRQVRKPIAGLRALLAESSVS